MKRAVKEYGDEIEYIEVDNDDKKNLEDWGISDAIFINDKQINTGPPPSYKKIQKFLKRKVEKRLI